MTFQSFLAEQRAGDGGESEVSVRSEEDSAATGFPAPADNSNAAAEGDHSGEDSVPASTGGGEGGSVEGGAASEVLPAPTRAVPTVHASPPRLTPHPVHSLSVGPARGSRVPAAAGSARRFAPSPHALHPGAASPGPCRRVTPTAAPHTLSQPRRRRGDAGSAQAAHAVARAMAVEARQSPNPAPPPVRLADRREAQAQARQPHSAQRGRAPSPATRSPPSARHGRRREPVRAHAVPRSQSASRQRAQSAAAAGPGRRRGQGQAAASPPATTRSEAADESPSSWPALALEAAGLISVRTPSACGAPRHSYDAAAGHEERHRSSGRGSARRRAGAPHVATGGSAHPPRHAVPQVECGEKGGWEALHRLGGTGEGEASALAALALGGGADCGWGEEDGAEKGAMPPLPNWRQFVLRCRASDAAFLASGLGRHIVSGEVRRLREQALVAAGVNHGRRLQVRALLSILGLSLASDSRSWRAPCRR